MDKFLRGNFDPKKEVVDEEDEKKDTLEARFEKKALKRLGGSIAFVSKKRVLWGDDSDDDSGETS